MTGIGWNTGLQRPKSCGDGAVAGTRAEGVSEKTQARFLELAYRCLAADPAVRVALWFSLQDVGVGAGYGDHLGLIRPGGRRKPAYRAMREVRDGKIRAARCGGASDRTAPSLEIRRPAGGAVFTDGENLPAQNVTVRRFTIRKVSPGSFGDSDGYAVRDGHHRVSVALARGTVAIDAVVVAG